MVGRIALAVAGVLLVIGAAYWFSRAPAATDEEQITQTILDIKQAIEDKNVGGVMKYVSVRYSDGTHTRQEINRLVVGGFRSPEPFRVHVEPPQIQVSGDRAQARVRAEFSAGYDTAAQSRVRLDILAELTRERGKWKVVRATGWEPAIGAFE